MHSWRHSTPPISRRGTLHSAMLATLPFALGLLLVACSKDEGPVAVPIDQAPEAVNSAFATAPDDVRLAAEKAAQSVAAGQYVNSYFSLEALSSNPNLTPEQRRALAESQMAVMGKITEAANQGDQQAEQAIQMHRARK